MTEQEIIDELNFCIETGERPYNDILEECKKAIAKQVEKKIIVKPTDYIANLYCPICEKKLDGWNKITYCDCGQKLDWERG